VAWLTVDYGTNLAALRLTVDYGTNLLPLFEVPRFFHMLGGWKLNEGSINSKNPGHYASHFLLLDYVTFSFFMKMIDLYHILLPHPGMLGIMRQEASYPLRLHMCIPEWGDFQDHDATSQHAQPQPGSVLDLK